MILQISFVRIILKYFHKQIPRIFTPNGEILFARSEEDYNKIIAMACLKKDDEELILSTVRISL